MKTTPKRSNELPTIAALVELETKLPDLLRERDQLRAALWDMANNANYYTEPVSLKNALRLLAELQVEDKP